MRPIRVIQKGVRAAWQREREKKRGSCCSDVSKEKGNVIIVTSL